MKKIIRKFYLIPLVTCAFIIGYFYFSFSKTKDTALQTHSPYSENIITNFGAGLATGGDFTLTQSDGQKFTFSNMYGKPSLLYFGFTHCPDFCPTSLQVFDKVDNLLGDNKINRIFVSIDPERDTVEKLHDYVSLYKKGLIGLTGTLEETDKVAKLWRVFYSLNKKSKTDTDYIVDHMTYLYLTDKNGKLIAMFRAEATAEEIANFIKTEKLL